MANSIIDGTNVNTSVFMYSAPKAHESGGKVVNLMNKSSKEAIALSTPLILTWGAQEGLDQAKKPTGKFTMSLQFPTMEYSNPDLENFLKSMKALEAKVKADAITYSKEWFGKTITNPEIIDEKFNIMLRHPKVKGSEELDLAKPPTLTVKLPCWKGVWKSEIYDEDGEPVFISGKVNNQLSPLDFIKKQTQVACVIQCGGIWFVNGKFSITWNLKQAVVQKPKESMEGKCLIKLKTADKEVLKKQVVEEIEEDDHISSAIVDDSDEEEEHVPISVFVPPVVVEEEKKPVPVPVVVAAVAAPVKKVVKKKVEA
jgi:hypothetical protein